MASGIEGGKYNLLLVDDNPSVLNGFGCALSGQGYCEKTSTSAEAAVEAMNTEDYDLVITELNLGCLDGLGLGLYLTREIIRKHGSDISYEAKEHGSDFVFTSRGSSVFSDFLFL